MDEVIVSWNSPHNNEFRSLSMTLEQAELWWETASYPVQCTATIKANTKQEVLYTSE